jgi:IBR domain, a half RING-finger domain
MDAECREILQHSDMRRIATEEVFEQYVFPSTMPSLIILTDRFSRYDKYATRSAVNALDDFIGCIRKDCKSGQEHWSRNGDEPIFECNACGHRHCVTHNVRWHIGETCKQYEIRANPEARRHEEEKSEKKIRKTTKRCPGCQVNIEGNHGCSHMKCKLSLGTSY